MNRLAKYITFLSILWSIEQYANLTPLAAQSLPHDDKITIVLDPGHGGHDRGCSGKHSIEKELALKIAIELGEKLEKELKDVEIIFTRRKDIFIPLALRTDIANKKGADLFISIHCNAISDKKVSGTETYVMGLHKSKENLNVAKRENKSILLESNFKSTYGGYDPDSPAGHILMSLYQNAYLQESLELATLIENSFDLKLSIKSRGVKQAGFVVLKTATMPSVLVETGFLTNDKDEQLLNSQSGRNQIVKSLFKAIKTYKETWAHQRIDLASKQKNDQISIKTKEYVIHGEIEEKSNTPITSTSTETLDKNPKGQTSVNSSIIFRVQLASTSKKVNLNSNPWSDINGIVEKQSGESFKYFSESYSEYSEAKKAQTRYNSNGFNGAFLVAFKDDQKIKISEALKSE